MAFLTSIQQKKSTQRWERTRLQQNKCYISLCACLFFYVCIESLAFLTLNKHGAFKWCLKVRKRKLKNEFGLYCGLANQNTTGVFAVAICNQWNLTTRPLQLRDNYRNQWRQTIRNHTKYVSRKWWFVKLFANLTRQIVTEHTLKKQ